MKLKRLEIFGFKSFHDRTLIDFPPGISAIVGPNGCGKSNVMDALRWVMGEQSAKQLRGKAMEDVIFTGANGRAPLNLAEVSLTLSNESGSLPEQYRDYGELLITRRMYRSGERAYFLNKQPCRLKDITDIFLGSGMGAKSYSFIQQGNIGAITDAGPEERRVFIEEAAGISRFKQRKTEALRKVETTRQNLLRLRDIIGEIERQRAGLKRQAKKAQFYQTHQRQIRELDIRLGLLQHRRLAADLATTEALLTELHDAEAGHLSDLRRLDAAIEQIKLQRLEQDQALAAQRSRKYDLVRQTDRMESELSHLQQEAQRLTRESEQLEGLRQELAAKGEMLQAEIDSETARQGELQNKSGELQAHIARENQSSHGLRQHLADLQRALEGHKAELMRLVAEEARCRNSYQTAESQRESLQRRLRRIDEEELLARRKLTALEQGELAAQQRLEEAKQALATLEARIGQLQAEARAASVCLAERVRALQNADAERHKVKSRAAALRKMAENFEWYQDGVRAVMKHPATASADGSGASAILGLVAELLEPEAGFGAALERALGESLQYVVVARSDTALESIAYLVESNAGRCGFIDLPGLPPPPAGDTPADWPAMLHPVLRHVRVRTGFEAVAQLLLGSVLVADTAQDALQARQAGLGDWTVVTRDGSLLLKRSSLLGGSNDSQAGILAKREELCALEAEAERLSLAAAAARAAQHEQEIQLRELEAELGRQNEGRQRAMREETEAEKERYKAGEELKHARRHLEIVTLEQEQLMGEAGEADESIARNGGALQRIAELVAAAQERMNAASSQIAVRQADLERFQQQVVDLRLNLTAVEAERTGSVNTLRRLKDYQQDSLRRLAEASADIQAKAQRALEARNRGARLRETLSQHSAALGELDGQLAESERRFAQIEVELQQSDSAIGAIKNQRETTLQKLRLVEVELSQRRLTQQAIGERLVDRYRQSFEELIATVEQTADNRSEEQLEAELTRCRRLIAKIGDVNLGAIREYDVLTERWEFLTAQRDDLEKALEDLQTVIRRINRISQQRFLETLEQVNAKLGEVFPRLFEGGAAHLALSDANNPLESGVEFMIHPPGKKLTHMGLLSGGEKALAAIAFIFAIFLIRPSSFCLLDEIDAPLDELNVFRFNNLMRLIGQQSQVIMITHNKRSMEFADTLLGITMEHKGVSKVVTVRFDQAA